VVQPGEQLRAATSASGLLARFAEPFQELLLSYPQGKPPDQDERSFWVAFNIDGRPTVALSHRLWGQVGGICQARHRRAHDGQPAQRDVPKAAGSQPVK